MDLESNAVGVILEASRDGEKLPWALMPCGVTVAVAALWLLVHGEVPAGVFLGHGEVVFYSYYGILVLVALFGLAEAWVGYCASCDLERWRAAGKKLLWFSILPLVLVLGLGGGLAFAATPK